MDDVSKKSRKLFDSSPCTLSTTSWRTSRVNEVIFPCKLLKPPSQDIAICRKNLFKLSSWHGKHVNRLFTLIFIYIAAIFRRFINRPPFEQFVNLLPPPSRQPFADRFYPVREPFSFPFSSIYDAFYFMYIDLNCLLHQYQL